MPGVDNWPVTTTPEHAVPPAENSATATGITTNHLRLDEISSTEVDALIIQHRLPGWADDFPQPMDYDAARQFFEEGLMVAAGDAMATRLLRERSTSEVVGTIGFLPVPEPGAVEVSYSVVPSRRGRGYATEALIALAHNALEHPEITMVTASTEADNTASVELLLTAGFLPEEGTGLSLHFVLRRPQLPEDTAQAPAASL